MIRTAEKIMGLAAMVVIAAAIAAGPARAQDKGLTAPGELSIASPSGPARAQDKALTAQELKFTEVKLTNLLIEGFLRAQQDMNALGDQAPASEAEELALQVKIDTISKAAGFTDYIAMDDAAQTIALVFSGIDPQSGSFVEPIEALNLEIAAVEADKALPEKVKTVLLGDLKEELAATGPLKYRGNIALVKTYHARISDVMK